MKKCLFFQNFKKFFIYLISDELLALQLFLIFSILLFETWVSGVFVISCTSLVISLYFSVITFLVWSINSSKLSRVMFSVEISGRAEIIMLPFVSFLFFSSRNVVYELYTTGKIGIFDWMATLKAPFLNSWICPVFRRVPEILLSQF